MRHTLVQAALTFAFVTASTASFAQTAPGPGGRVSGSFGGSFGDGGATVTTAAAASVRFTSHVGMEFEAVFIPDLEFSSRFEPIPLARGGTTVPPSLGGRPGIVPIRIETTGRTVAFLTKFVAEFPTGVRWLRPYVSGGGGAGQVVRRVDGFFGRAGRVPGEILNFPVRESFSSFRERRSETDLVLTTGGGVDFEIWRGLAIGADVRYLRLLGEEEDLDLAQVGTRISYRF